MSQQSQNKIFLSSELLQPYYETILTYLGVEYTHIGNRISGPCPIHGGDNPTAWTMWLDGYSISGNWKCFTRNCHHRATSFTGFIAKFMSAKYNKRYTEQHAEKWLMKFLNIKDGEIGSIDAEKLALHRQIQHTPLDPDVICPRSEALKHLDIPSAYFLTRHYKPETLKFFDVGECVNPRKKLYGRAVVPVYTEDKQGLIGCTSRSTANRCDICGTYHHGNCPTNNLERWKANKWLHLCPRERVLYNSWHARKYIEETNSVIIVESPGNVWRLWEAGYYNCVAVLGASISEYHLNLLNKMMVLNIYVCGDNDRAGRSLVTALKSRCERRFLFNEIKVSGPDIGEMRAEQLRSELSDQNLTYCWQKAVRQEQCV